MNYFKVHLLLTQPFYRTHTASIISTKKALSIEWDALEQLHEPKFSIPKCRLEGYKYSMPNTKCPLEGFKPPQHWALERQN